MHVPLPSRTVTQLGCARVLALALTLVATGTASSFGQTRPSRSYYVYVCAESDDQVALVRYGPNGADVVKTIPVGSFPAETEGPHGINVSPDGRYWYVSLAHGFPFGSVHKYETDTDEWVTDVTLGMFPATLDISASTGLMYIVNFNLHGPLEPSSVSVVETRTMTEVAQVETGIRPHGARLSRDGRHLYTVSMMDDELVELDALTFDVSRRLALSPHARSVGDGTSGMPDMASMVQPTWASRPTPQGTVYVPGNNTNEILEVDLERWSISRRFEDTGAGPYNLDVTPDGNTLVVTYKKAGSIGFWDLDSGRELASVKTIRVLPHGVAITPDGQYAFATIEGIGGEPGGVEIYDIPTRTRVGDVEIGKQAGGIAFWKMDP